MTKLEEAVINAAMEWARVETMLQGYASSIYDYPAEEAAALLNACADLKANHGAYDGEKDENGVNIL